MIIDWRSFVKRKTISDKGGFPYGSRVYKAHIGGGKTLSMTHDIFELKRAFPKMVTFANFNIYGLNDFHLITNETQMYEALEYQNGDDGVVVAIDEAHLFWSKKDGIPVEVLSSISYQRKDRRKIMMTTQVWDELPVSTRKQVKEVVSCNRFLNVQWNIIYNGNLLKYDKKDNEYVAPKINISVFKHNDELYKSFNTYQKAIKNSDFELDTLIGGRSSPPPAPSVSIKVRKV